MWIELISIFLYFVTCLKVREKYEEMLPKADDPYCNSDLTRGQCNIIKSLTQTCTETLDILRSYSLRLAFLIKVTHPGLGVW